MRGWFLGIAVLALSLAGPSAAAQIIIDGFAPDLGPSDHDDAVALRNLGAAVATLDNVTLHDNGGSLRFPHGMDLESGGTRVIAENATAWHDASGQWPDASLDDARVDHRLLHGEGDFSLSRTGDLIRLDGGADDLVVFGDGHDSAWNGAPLNLSGGTLLRWFPRTDAAARGADGWTPSRRSVAGEELWPPASTHAAGTLIAYTAPEESRGVVKATLLSARSSVRINVYQFRDLALARDIAAHMRATPGLHVDVLLDDRPVGENAEELSDRGHVIDTLREAGASVHMLAHTRYAYDHAKYVVVDDEVLLVQSENFVDSGIPTDGVHGNRGWGVVVDDADLARQAATMFDADFRIRPFGARDAGAQEEPRFPEPLLGSDVASSNGALSIAGAKNVTFVATPFAHGGMADPLLDLIRGATTDIEVLQLDFAPLWRSPTGGVVPHPYLVALADAAKRGVAVRMVLDGHFIDDEGSTGSNARTVDAARSDPAYAGIEARLQKDPRPVVHAKGLVVDGRSTFVGSINWNANSILQNRETGLIVDDARVAAFFRASFEDDWRADGAHGLPGLGVATIITAALVGALIPRGRART